MGERNGMPRPEAIWVALGIVVAALAAALGPRRRRSFLAALRSLARDHEGLERVVVFGPVRDGDKRVMSQAVRGGVAFIRRLVSELEDGEAS